MRPAGAPRNINSVVLPYVQCNNKCDVFNVEANSTPPVLPDVSPAEHTLAHRAPRIETEQPCQRPRQVSPALSPDVQSSKATITNYGTYHQSDPRPAHLEGERRVESYKCNNESNEEYETINGQSFNEIRIMCDIVDDGKSQGPNPYELASHRRKNWPRANALPPDIANIYSEVRKSGLPNSLGKKIPVPSKLNLDMWDATFGEDERYTELLSFVRYGFPMGYMGPTAEYDEKYNHTSAVNYPGDIEGFIQKEIGLGGIIGPLNEQPFAPWVHCAPIMSRPKRDSDSRRIIADLSFPQEKSINAFIMRNAVWGETRDHSLPTVKNSSIT